MVKIDFNYFLVKIAKSEPECGIEIMSYFPTDPKGYSIEPFYLKNVVTILLSPRSLAKISWTNPTSPSSQCARTKLAFGLNR